MRWRDLASELDARPGFREAYAEQFPYANVALAIVALRARHDLTQRALAERVGTPQPVIARLESGRHPVEIKLLSRVAAAVGESWTVAFDSDGAAVDIDPPTSGDALLDAFNEANTASDFETASVVATQIARDPSTPRRRLALALDAYNRGSHAEAERWGREAVADADLPEPSREVALLVVGRSVLNLDRPKEALRVLRPLRKPKYIGWLRDAALAEAHLEADQPEAAQAAVDRVLGAVDVPEAHYLAARILWHRDQLWPALEQVVFYRASQPDDPSGLLLHGSILGFLGDAKSYPGAHEAALELFARAVTQGGCEAIRLHGVTAARVGRWQEALEDARRLLDEVDGHDMDHHRSAVEAIVGDVFSHLPDDTARADPAIQAERLLGSDHDLVRVQRALVAGLGGDMAAAAEILGLDPAHVESAPVSHQLAMAAALITVGRTAESAAILARNVDDLSTPDGLIQLAGNALEVDDIPTASLALERLAESAGSTGEVAALANRLLEALARGNDAASVTGVTVGGFVWSDVTRRDGPLTAVDSTWEGHHAPSSAVMDRLTRTFLH